mmetsp:Transcript_22558/g.53432  ORF Transcript_22558/g.53432 Transcript_22558/m.53432 type:complete len:241 (+) Transcript_22558:253-975(+)
MHVASSTRFIDAQKSTTSLRDNSNSVLNQRALVLNSAFESRSESPEPGSKSSGNNRWLPLFPFPQKESSRTPLKPIASDAQPTGLHSEGSGRSNARASAEKEHGSPRAVAEIDPSVANIGSISARNLNLSQPTHTRAPSVSKLGLGVGMDRRPDHVRLRDGDEEEFSARVRSSSHAPPSKPRSLMARLCRCFPPLRRIFRSGGRAQGSNSAQTGGSTRTVEVERAVERQAGVGVGASVRV